MKFIVGKTTLLDAVTMVGKCVPANNTVIPILENFLFTLEDSKLTIAGTDLLTTLITTLEVEGEGNIAIAIPSKILVELLKTLPDQPIEFMINAENNAICITAGEGFFNLTGETSSDFPKIPVIETPSSFGLPAMVLADAINKTLFAVSGDELRPAMTGVLCSLGPDSMTFVATDARKLVRYIRKDTIAESKVDFILPKKALSLLKSILPHEDVIVSIEYNKTSAFFNIRQFRLICRLIDEAYPDYEAIVPKNNPNIVLVDRMLLINALNRVGVFSNKETHQVKLDIDSNRIIITAEDGDYSYNGKDSVECQYTGTALTIGFNVKLLVELLKVLDTDQITIQMSGHNRPTLLFPFEGDESEELMALAMPLMLN